MGWGHGNLGGGAGGLNYRVMASASAPSVAGKPNDIVLVTSVSVGNVQLNCASAPSLRSDGTALQAGDVYIAALTTTAVPFNALKKNALYGLPGACYQYDGAAWNSMDAYIYQGGAWVQFSTTIVYLYNDGDQCTDVGGSWDVSGYSYHSVYAQQNPILQSTYIQCGPITVASTASFAGKSNKIDITGFSTIEILYSQGSANSRFYLGTQKTNISQNSIASAVDTKNSSKNNVTLLMDISSVTPGEYYFGGGHSDAGYSYIQRVLMRS